MDTKNKVFNVYIIYISYNTRLHMAFQRCSEFRKIRTNGGVLIPGCLLHCCTITVLLLIVCHTETNRHTNCGWRKLLHIKMVCFKAERVCHTKQNSQKIREKKTHNNTNKQYTALPLYGRCILARVWLRLCPVQVFYINLAVLLCSSAVSVSSWV